jgi:glycosyltransferase involved in cell wall biosynthesis
MIIINGRFFSRRPTGVDRFAYEVISSINDLIGSSDPAVQGLSFKIMLPPGVEPKQKFAHIPMETVGRNTGQLWEQWDLPCAAPKESLLLNLCNTAPAWRSKQLVVIHDVSTARMPQSYSWVFRTWYAALIPLIYRRSRSVCTVSNFSRKELAALYGNRSDICVLPEGTDHMARVTPDPGVLVHHQLLERPYVLAVSSLSPHKNFAIVVRAMQIMGDSNFNLVVAGGQDPKVFASTADDLSAAVKYVGYVSDEELKALYEHAACFVFPSIYEGYGLPPTEAMACGCPVLAANAASIPEVCGDAALYFNPHDPDALAAQISRLMTDETLREKLCASGRTHTDSMLWCDAALVLVNEIRRVLK